METTTVRRKGEWFVLISWEGGHEEAGPWDDEADAMEAQERIRGRGCE